MEPITVDHAYYVKLGRGGQWEERSLREDLIRIGWAKQKLVDINHSDWDKITQEIEAELRDKGATTRDVNALRCIVNSAPGDVWITFHASQLWWCLCGEPGIKEDGLSRYRQVDGHWCNTDIHSHVLLAGQLPGNLAKLQRFQGTICRVKAVGDLRRLLNDQASEAAQAISAAQDKLISAVEVGLKQLHWKDFEVLTDLVFRGAGWRRTSVVGESMKFVDIELEEPLTGDMYQVQVKSVATLAEFRDYCDQFSGGNFRKLYFVVHSPQGDLQHAAGGLSNNVELILPRRLAQLLVEMGLTPWLLRRIH